MDPNVSDAVSSSENLNGPLHNEQSLSGLQFEELLIVKSRVEEILAIATQQSEVDKYFLNENSFLREDKMLRPKESNDLSGEAENKALCKSSNLACAAVQYSRKEQNKTITFQEELQVSKNRNKEEEFVKLRAENMRLTYALTSYDNAMDALNKERNEKHALQKEQDVLSQVCRSREEEMKHMSDTIASVVQANSVLDEELGELKKESNIRGEDTEKQQVTRIARAAGAFTHHEKTEREIGKETKKMLTPREELDGLKKESCMKDDKIEELCAQNFRIRTSWGDHQDTAKNTVEEKHTIQEELDASKEGKCLREEEIKRLQAKILRLTRAAVDHQGMVDLGVKSDERDTLQKIVDELKEVNRVKDENLKAENSGFTRDLAVLQKRVDMLKEAQEQNGTLQETLYGLKEVNRVKDEQIEELRAENARITRASTVHQNTVEILKKVQRQKLSLREERDRLKKYSCMREEEMAQLRAETACVTRALADHQHTVKILKREQNKKRELEEALMNANSMKDQTIERLFAENLGIKRALAKHQNSGEVLKKEQQQKRTIQRELDRLKAESFEKEEEVKKLRAEIARARRTLADHEHTLEDLRAERGEKHALQQTVAGLKEVNCVKNEQIKELSAENLRLKNDLADSKNNVEGESSGHLKGLFSFFKFGQKN